MGLGIIIDVAAIVLALTAMGITTIGFFASLRFYRDGVELQTQVRELLSRIEEKVASVQSQVGGMFDKTLDAALAGAQPREAAEAQRKLIRGASAATTDETSEEGEEETVDEQQDDGLPEEVVDYLAFKKLRLTDVSTVDGRAIFMLGAGRGFNLFDGTPGIVFFGYFVDQDDRDVVARVRFLLDAIEASYTRVEKFLVNQQHQALAVLSQISIEVLVHEETDTTRLEAVLARYQPTTGPITTVLTKPSELSRAVQDEYEKMNP